MPQIVIATADGSKQRGFRVPEGVDLDRLFVALIRFARFLEAGGYLEGNNECPGRREVAKSEGAGGPGE